VGVLERFVSSLEAAEGGRSKIKLRSTEVTQTEAQIEN
jgi:hypothetical protein